MKEYTDRAMNRAELARAEYADMRLTTRRTQRLIVRNGRVEAVEETSSEGFGVRVLVKRGVGLRGLPPRRDGGGGARRGPGGFRRQGVRDRALPPSRAGAAGPARRHGRPVHHAARAGPLRRPPRHQARASAGGGPPHARRPEHCHHDGDDGLPARAQVLREQPGCLYRADTGGKRRRHRGDGGGAGGVSAPLLPELLWGAVCHRRLRVCRGDGAAGQRRARGERGSRPADRGSLPWWHLRRHHQRPAGGAPGARELRPPHRTGSGLWHRGCLCGHLLPHPRQAVPFPVRLGGGEHRGGRHGAHGTGHLWL